MPGDPCERFAPFLEDPRAYVAAQTALDLEEVGRRAGSGEPVTVTARSLGHRPVDVKPQLKRRGESDP